MLRELFDSMNLFGGWPKAKAIKVSSAFDPCRYCMTIDDGKLIRANERVEGGPPLILIITGCEARNYLKHAARNAPSNSCIGPARSCSAADKIASLSVLPFVHYPRQLLTYHPAVFGVVQKCELINVSLLLLHKKK